MTSKGVYGVLEKKFSDPPVNSPLEFKYIKKLCFMLSSLGTWPHDRFGNHRLHKQLKLYSIIVVTVAVASPSLAVLYIYVYWNKISFFDLGHILLTICLDLMFLPRLPLAFTNKYRNLMKDYLLGFHLFYFKDKSEYATQIFSLIHVTSGIITFYGNIMTYLGPGLFNFMPWYNNYSRGMFSEERPANRTFEHAVYYIPADDLYTSVRWYWVLFVFNIYNSYNVTCGLVSFDLLLSLIVFQIWGHLKILIYNLRRFPQPKSRSGMYSAEENREIHKLLKENIEHHSIVVTFVDSVSNVFNEYLLIFYLLVQVISCILLLEVSSFDMDSFAKYGPLTLLMYQQLITASVLFEMVNTKSEQLMEAVYDTPWEAMDRTNRKTVLLLLHRVQKPVSIKAAKMVPVGVQTMFGIIKTSFSYYMMLKTVARE